MVYTCQFCGAWFSKDQLDKVISNNEKSISCGYCGNTNVIENMRASHVTKGYDSLEYGDFHEASMEFGLALKSVKDLDVSNKTEFIDAYLGRALSEYSVQVIYDGEIADPSEEPEINCYICNDELLDENMDYQIALKIAHSIPNDSLRAETINRVQRFAKKIDGIKRVYDRKSARGEEYQLFIACEDNRDNIRDAQAGLNVANKIKDNMPSSVINRIFVQDRDAFSEEDYEGEILYALHHSKCMLVAVDNDIDPRLMNLYSRYHRAMRTEGDKELGFVRFKDRIHIHLPDQSIAKSVYDINEKNKYVKFVCEANQVYYVAGPEVPKGFTSDDGAKAEPESHVDTSDIKAEGNGFVIDGRVCRFGSYPQRKVIDRDIIAAFESEPKPAMSNPNGWQIMLTTKTGAPFTWYKDKEIDGNKYRAVYFMRYRQVFTLRNSDIQPSVQRVSNYLPMRIHVFAFEDIEWNILDISSRSATLVSSVGLDSCEFNNGALCSDWECSSIRRWLNEDFYNTAFSEEQKKQLWHNSDDESVSLLDSDLEFTNRYYRDKLNTYNISGSDYFRCVGGSCDKSVRNFWIKSPMELEDRAASVQPHSVSDIVMQCVDNTAVSVLPIIRINLAKRSEHN